MEQFVIERLRERFGDRVTTASDADYDTNRAAFNATVQRRPAVIVRVRSDAEVAAAIVAANDLGLPIAVRGGGHSVAGHSMADRALVVDQRDRRRVRVDPDSRLVTAAPGAQWDDVDVATWPYHLAIVGGTFGDTGIAGLTLGGGIGWLSGLQGLTCDNLLRAELITATGARVVAGPDGDRDLLWALRGGGGNFGVVTSMTFQAIDPGPILAGYLTCPIGATKQVLRRVAEISATAPDALELIIWIGSTDAHPDGPTIRVGVCLPGDLEAGEEILRPLRAALPTLSDTVEPMAYPDVQAMSGQLPFGLRHYWKGHFLRELDEVVITAIVESMVSRPEGASGILLESIRGAARREPSGGAAFGQREATWNASALGIWEEPDGDDEHIAWARATADRLSVGSLSGAGYANYAPVDETNERVRAAFGTERFERLAQIKAQYDPDNRFRFNLNIGPAVVQTPTDEA